MTVNSDDCFFLPAIRSETFRKCPKNPHFIHRSAKNKYTKIKLECIVVPLWLKNIHILSKLNGILQLSISSKEALHIHRNVKANLTKEERSLCVKKPNFRLKCVVVWLLKKIIHIVMILMKIAKSGGRWQRRRSVNCSIGNIKFGSETKMHISIIKFAQISIDANTINQIGSLYYC